MNNTCSVENRLHHSDSASEIHHVHETRKVGRWRFHAKCLELATAGRNTIPSLERQHSSTDVRGHAKIRKKPGYGVPVVIDHACSILASGS